MKKFNKFICISIFGFLGLFAGNAYAAQAGFNTPVTNDFVTNWTKVGNVIFYDAYVENTTGEIFTGSTTTSGGTSTFSAGVADVSSYLNNEYFSFYGSPTTAGSVTVQLYGVFGTTTAGAGTSNASLLDIIVNGTRQKSYVYAGTIATSTSFYTDFHPVLMAVGLNVTSGTMTITIGMNSIAAR